MIWEFKSEDKSPSQRVSKCDFMVKFQSRSMGLRFLVRASTSSRNMTQGLILRASVNRASKYFSVSPTHLSRTRDIGRTKKRKWASLARALANIVFPQPGGPYSKIPVGACSNLPFGGWSIVERFFFSASITSLLPPISKRELETTAQSMNIPENLQEISEGCTALSAISASYLFNWIFSCSYKLIKGFWFFKFTCSLCFRVLERKKRRLK